jgi:hypothetical protein
VAQSKAKQGFFECNQKQLMRVENRKAAGVKMGLNLLTK